MSKRRGENLARTKDGATYNKLRRPDDWPSEPSRTPTINDNEAEEQETSVQEDGQVHTDSDEEFSRRSRKRKRIYSLKKKNPSAADGCLPMDDEDFSDLGDDSVSFAALQYLKGVRAEADDLPVVSKAPMTREESKDEHRGYYEDGAYIVAPELGPALPNEYNGSYGGDGDFGEGEEELAVTQPRFRQITACEAYTNALISRFRSLRNSIRVLQANPMLRTGSESGGLEVSSIRKLQETERRHWQQIMDKDIPQPSQLASTSLPALLSLLLIIKEQCLLRKKNIPKSISLWLLALLASIDERTIDSESIYDIRDLAKKAIWLRIDFEPRYAEASEAMAREAGYLSNDEDSDGKPSTQIEVESQFDAEEMLSDLLVEETVPDDPTKATLDMVITIVGEGFGQRDLLESRVVVDWPQVGDEVEDGEIEIEDL